MGKIIIHKNANKQKLVEIEEDYQNYGSLSRMIESEIKKRDVDGWFVKQIIPTYYYATGNPMQSTSSYTCTRVIILFEESR